MKRLRIIGSEKSTHHNVFIFKKEKNFFELFRNFLYTVCFENNSIEISDFGKPLNKKSGIYDRFKNDDIAKYFDVYEKFEGRNISVDIFFGEKKVIVVIRTKKDMQQELMNNLLKFSSW